MSQRLNFLLLAFLLLVVIAGVSGTIRKAGGRNKERNKIEDEKKSKKEKDEKEEKEDDDKNDEIELNDLPLNTTLKCHRGVNETAIKANFRYECDPGEICWRSKTKTDIYRGCATRKCTPTVIQLIGISSDSNQTNETNNNDKSVSEQTQEDTFLNNICCLKDFCNRGARIRTLPWNLPAFILIYLISLA